MRREPKPNRSIVRRAVTALAVLALGLTILPPAWAAEPEATASINADDREILAGGQADVRVTVEYPLDSVDPGNLDPITHVRIAPPLVSQGLFTPVDGQASGWDVDAGGSRIAFDANSPDDGIEPNSSQEFTATVDVGRFDRDLHRDWAVTTSTDGVNFKGATPASDGALRTSVRVLSLQSVAVTTPAEVAANDRATAGQDNIQAACTVENLASVDLSVDADLAGGIAETIVDAPDATITAGTSHTFVFDVTMGGPGSGTLDCTAVSGSDAVAIDGATGDTETSTNTITVESAPDVAYVADSLTPTTVVPGTSVAFEVEVDKTGSAAVDLNLQGTTFIFGPNNDFVAQLLQPNQLGTGGGTVVLQFEEETIPTLADGSYNPVVMVRGTDHNGFDVDIRVSVSDPVHLDTTIPSVSPVLTPEPPSQVSGEEDAATDHDPGAAPPLTDNEAKIVFSGDVEDKGGPCDGEDCSVVSAAVRQFDENQDAIAGEDIDVTADVSIDGNGQLQGEFQGTYHADARWLRLAVEVSDDAGNTTGEVLSAFVPVDNQPPELASAQTGGPNGLDRSKLRVQFNEGVTTVLTSPTDWLVDGGLHLVLDVSFGGDLEGPLGGEGESVVLTVVPEIGEDADLEIEYCPVVCPVSFEDRVALPMLPQTIAVDDGILPDPPTIEQVSNGGNSSPLGPQDGKLYTNESTPTFHFGEVDAGHEAEAWWDVNADGVVDPADDTHLCTTSGSSCTSTVSFGNDMEIQVLPRAIDGAGNTRSGDPETLVLDFTAPEIDWVGREDPETCEGARATFTERLARGRNHPDDWQLYADIDGFEEQLAVSVVDESDTPSRTICIEDHRYVEGDTPLTRLVHEHLGSSSRYEDRAGNFLADFDEGMTSQAPQGDWVGNFGADGHVLGAWNGSSDLVGGLPSGTTVTLEQGTRAVWDSETTEVRALEAPDESFRRLATYTSFRSDLRVRIEFGAAYEGAVHLYAVDRFTTSSRLQAFSVDDGTAVRTIEVTEGFGNGVWGHFAVSAEAGAAIVVGADRRGSDKTRLAGIFLG